MDLNIVKARARAANTLPEIDRIFQDLASELDLDFVSYRILTDNFHTIATSIDVPLPNIAASQSNFITQVSNVVAASIVSENRQDAPATHWNAPTSNSILAEKKSEISNTLQGAGYIDGLNFFISSPQGDLALVSMSKRGRKFEFSESELAQLKLAFEAIHLQWRRILNNLNSKDDLLSEREKQTMELVISGRSNKEIAQELNLSAHTIDIYLRRIFQKFAVHNRVQAAVKYALIYACELPPIL